MSEPPDPGDETPQAGEPQPEEPPHDAQDTRPLKKPGGEGPRPRAAVLSEAPPGEGRAALLPPSPLEETGRVRLVPRPAEMRPWRVILHTVRPRGTSIGLNVWQMLIVGRADPRSRQTPDLDMTPHGAESLGVSRLHAVLIPGADALYLADLESTNGTWVNRKYLEPGERHALAPGDVIDLGLLRLEVRSVTRLGGAADGEAG